MTFKHLLSFHGHLDWREQNPETPVCGLYFDSREVTPDSIYVAIRGHHLDGHQFLDEAIKRGAGAVVVEDASEVPASFKGAVLLVSDTKLGLQILSQRFFENPGGRMTGIAVTGTNGKTSCAYLLEFFLNQVGRSCGLIGTVDSHFGKQVWKTKLTTPDPITLQQRLRDFFDLGAKSFVIEASSHALCQNRVRQGFDICLFTNLSRDHLDYHKNMEDYFSSKAQLFSDEMVKENKETFAVINGDDPYGLRLKSLCNIRKPFLFGRGEQNDFTFHLKSQSLDGSEITLKLPSGRRVEFFCPLIGEHNASNVVGSLACLHLLGFQVHELALKLSQFEGILGRLQLCKSSKGIYVFIDYAHTPAALCQVLDFLSSQLPSGKKLITVFGCGGDRDQGKRPLMGQTAEKYSDHLVITSDNPRTENPDSIIKDILKGLGQKDLPVCVERDRSLAIEKAVNLATPGDLILVAGKGHEDYQVLGDKRTEFRDDQKVMEAFARRDHLEVDH